MSFFPFKRILLYKTVIYVLPLTLWASGNCKTTIMSIIHWMIEWIGMLGPTAYFLLGN